MRYSVHKLRINLMTYSAGFTVGGRSLDCSIITLEYRYIPSNHPVHQLVRLADTVRYLADNYLFPIKPIHRNLSIRCDDNAVRFVNLLRCKYIFGAAGASGLHLYKAAPCFCRLLNSFGCHIGMSNSCRTSGNSQNLHLLFFRLFWFASAKLLV